MNAPLRRRILVLAAVGISALVATFNAASVQALLEYERQPTRAQVAAVQSQLAALGVEPGPIDGKLGPRTRAAIRTYQHVAGLPPTGEITPALSKALSDDLLHDERNRPDAPLPAPESNDTQRTIPLRQYSVDVAQARPKVDQRK